MDGATLFRRFALELFGGPSRFGDYEGRIVFVVPDKFHSVDPFVIVFVMPISILYLSP